MDIPLRILQLLLEESSQTPEAIADRLEVSESTVEASLEYLLQMRFISRVSRGLYVVTPLGEKFLQTVNEE